MLHSLRALSYRNYRLYFAGQGLSVLGIWVQQVAMMWLVYRLTGSPFWLGATAFAGQIPLLILAPLGGVWSDRFDRRRLLIIAQVIAFVQALVLAVLDYAQVIEVWHVLAMALALGCVMAIETPIRQSLTKELVPSVGDLPSAIALNGVIQNGGRMIGPTIAGLLILYTGEAFCFLANALSKVAVVWALIALRLPASAPSRATPVLQGFRDGLAYCRESVVVRTLLPVVGVIAFTATPYQPLMPVFADKVFGGGPQTLGWLLGASGLGGCIGLLTLASRPDVRGLSRWIVGGAVGTGVSLAVFAHSTSLPLSLVAIAVTGFSLILSAMSISTIFQTIVPDHMRGRVMGFFTMAFLGLHPVGALAAGALADRIGAAHTLALGGACCVVAAIWLARKLDRLRTAIRPIYVKLGISQE